MNRTETSQLLALIALVDNRPVTPEVVVVWHELLDGITYAEAVAAMKAYYRDNAKWLMPAHIVEIVTASRREVSLEDGRRKRQMRDWLTELGIDWVQYEAGDPDTIAQVEQARQQAVES